MTHNVGVWLQCDGCGKGYGEAMKRADHWHWQSYPLWDDGLSDRYTERRQAAWRTAQERITAAAPISYSGSRLENLNDAEIDADPGPTAPIRAIRPSLVAAQCPVDVHFQDLESVLEAEIRRWPVVVGCMAWLTNDAILGALADCYAAQIIVQKEDFLRPDVGGWSKEKLRTLYGRIKDIGKTESGVTYSYGGSDTVDGVRCLGICADRSRTPPRMHHKFLVFCSLPSGGDPASWIGRAFDAQAVWTGSFNATNNATRSLENGVLIRAPKIAEAYYQEWKTLLGLSEPLDWKSAYIDPEYRIGT